MENMASFFKFINKKKKKTVSNDAVSFGFTIPEDINSEFNFLLVFRKKKRRKKNSDIFV